MRGHHVLVTATLVLLAACGAEDADYGEGDGPGEPGPAYVGAEGIAIDQVAIYQGVKRVLAQGGAPVQSNVPLITGRDAMLRVFYAAPQARVGEQVVGRLQIEGATDPIEVDSVLAAFSVDGDLRSTINFPIPGELIDGQFGYRVSVLEEAGQGATDNPTAHHPIEGVELHGVDGPQNKFRVVLAPLSYMADGSGRTPDMSPERVEAFRERFMQLYPVTDVEVTAREPQPWYQPIAPNGQGWQEVGVELFGYRNKDGASDDVYYYGIFNPAPSFASYCGFGCLLGVTLLNDQPIDTGQVGLRMALGVGFEQVATDTAAHELGHAHGRMHANCGDGLDPSSIDPAYPHPNGQIGVWGWDIVSGSLIDPVQYSDIMGYCDQQWISDYNFAALLNRAKHVNAPRHHPPTSYQLVAVDGEGNASWHTVTTRIPMSSKPVAVSLTSAAGPSQVEGYFYRYDHLPGGWLMFPEQPIKPQRAEFVADGAFVIAQR